MVVDEDHVAVALAYLGMDPHPVAIARKSVTDAENHCKEIFSRAFLSASGSVDARKATAEIDPSHIAAKAQYAEAVFDLERHKAKRESAGMLIEVWREDNWNARAAEKVR